MSFKWVPRVTGWSRRGFWLSALVLALLWLSGMLLYFIDETERRPWAIVHGVSAWWAVGLGGCFVVAHIALCRQRVTHSLQRNSGWASAVLLGALVLTGWGLMYGPGDVHDTLVLGHFVLGAPLPLWLALHLWRGHSGAARITRAGPPKT
jgi:hypothetical protein